VFSLFIIYSFYQVDLFCLVVIWWILFVVELRVADSYVADNYVHIPSLRPIKFFSNLLHRL
jgi:hypothetical protein